MRHWGTDNPDVILALLDAGANLNARNKYGGTPLHEAALGAQNPAVLTALVNAGADLNARDNNRGTPLHDAAATTRTPTVIPALAAAGADLNARNDHGNTPLHEAVHNENPDVIFALVEAGARPPLKMKRGLLAPALLDYARGCRRVRPRSSRPFAQCLPPVRIGVRPCRVHGFDLRGARRNWSPSTGTSLLSLVRTCLEAGVDPHARNTYNQTPLHSAALYSNNPGVVVALLDGGADPNAGDNNRRTPLHSAARFSNNPAVVAALLDAGADPNARSLYDSTPLDIAIEKDRPAAIIAALRGEPVAHATSIPVDCTDWAAGDAEIREAFYGNLTPEAARSCLEAGADPNARSRNYRSPLIWASAFSDDPAVVVVLLDAGADLHAHNLWGYTPLHGAAGWNDNPAVVAALLDAGADPDLKTNSGEITPGPGNRKGQTSRDHRGAPRWVRLRCFAVWRLRGLDGA